MCRARVACARSVSVRVLGRLLYHRLLHRALSVYRLRNPAVNYLQVNGVLAKVP
jgi:hypothetical protein